MATFILKILGIAYVLFALVVAIFYVGIGHAEQAFYSLLAPIFLWPAYLVICVLTGLVLRAIDEHKES